MKLALVLLLCSCGDDDSGPRITSLSPAAARHSESVTVLGLGMCAGVPTCHGLGGTIQLGLGSPSYQTPPYDVTDEMWKFAVPDIVPVGETDLLITLSGRSSNALPFEVLP